MKRLAGAVAVAVALCCGAADVAAQTRADSAAVLINAAEQLRLRGENGAARALLDLISRQYAGTPAAADVARIRALLRRAPDEERSGRTELMVFGTTYGAWLGIALPIAVESTDPTAYGLGLLLGAPAGFLASRAYANAKSPTEGQTRALTFGGLWGTLQGFAWAEALDIGVDEFCDPPEFGNACHQSGPDADAVVAAGVVGGLLGIGTGAVLARKPITAGTAAATTLGGLWGTWFSWGLTSLAGQDDDALLTTTLLGGNVALLATGLAAPGWQMSESRARLISVGGVIGGLAGTGIMLILRPDEEKVAIASVLTTSAIGLIAASSYTRNRDMAPTDDGGGAGALLDLRDGNWSLGMPQPAVAMQRTRSGLRPAAYVPLLSARF